MASEAQPGHPAIAANRFQSVASNVVRWALFVPAGLVVCFVAYFVGGFVNSFGSGLPSGIVWLFASAISGYFAAVAAAVVVPQFRGYGAAALSVVLTLASALIVGRMIEHSTSSRVSLNY